MDLQSCESKQKSSVEELKTHFDLYSTATVVKASDNIDIQWINDNLECFS